MENQDRARIREALRYCRDAQVRSKLTLFWNVCRSGNVVRTCERLGVVPKTYYFWWNRFVAGGYSAEALQCRSRRPKLSPCITKGPILKWIKYYRKQFRYGPDRIQFYLKLNHSLHVAQSTVGEIIKREKLVLRKNKKPKKNTHTKRYSLPWPGDRMQMDIKYVPFRIGGKRAYVFNAIDDCSRFRVSKLYWHKGMREAMGFLDVIKKAIPFKLLSLQLDNDTAFTNRLHPLWSGTPHPFEIKVKDMGVDVRFIPPGEKELQGKVERLHRTDDDEFFWKAPRCSFEQLERKLHHWVYEYNHRRHHKSLNRKTPAQVIQEKYIEKLYATPYQRAGPVPNFRQGVQIISGKKNIREPWVYAYRKYPNEAILPPSTVTDVSGYYITISRKHFEKKTGVLMSSKPIRGEIGC